jgi:5-hydroxyisourate hydrolase-like protein (transthyretin family)
MIVRAAAMVLFMVAQAALQQQGVVEGTVVNAVDGAPIEDVQVYLSAVTPATPYEQQRRDVTIPSIVTDRDGRFLFKDLPAGSYRLSFVTIGYVRQEYGQRIFPGNGVAIQVGDAASGQTPGTLVVRLIPTAVVAGRIRDGDKQPIAHVEVRLLRYTYDSQGKKVLNEYASTRTDDRGNYRIHSVTPGRYYLSTGTPAGPVPEVPWNRPNLVPDIYAFAYYPGSADIAQAKVVDIRSGQTIDGMDMTLGNLQTVRVRGRVVDARTGGAPAVAHLQLLAYDPLTGQRIYVQARTDARLSQDGTFEFSRVLPGWYTIGAMTSIEDRNRPVERPPGGPRGFSDPTGRSGAGYTYFEVRNADIENLTVILRPVVTVRGRWAIEGAELPSIPPKGTVRLQWLNGMSPIPGENEPFDAALNADGTILFEGLVPGKYRLSFEPAERGRYLKVASYDGTDVPDDRIIEIGPEPQRLELLIGASPALVDGAVTDEQLVPARGARVVLVPDNRNRLDLYRSAIADQNGRFVITDVVPGDYRIFAWEAL